MLYWCAIFCGAGFVFLFFFMEETNYSRSVTLGIAEASPAADAVDHQTDTEKQAPRASIDAPSSPVETPRWKRTTYWDKLKLFRAHDLHKPNRLIGMATRPLVFLSFPVISYAGFSYGSNLVWFNVLNGTASTILSGPPYDFPASLVGVAYVSPLIGVALASFYTGWLGDRIVLRLARRNAGILEPEQRLWLFVPSLLLLPFGLILWGVGAAHRVHWFGCVFAMGVIGLTNVVGLTLSVAYCIDSYRALAGEAVVTVILVRNTMSFAVNYGITPWVTGMGYQNAFLVAAFAGMAQCATVFIFIKYGKELRRRSAPRYAKYVEKMASSGVLH